MNFDGNGDLSSSEEVYFPYYCCCPTGFCFLSSILLSLTLKYIFTNSHVARKRRIADKHKRRCWRRRRPCDSRLICALLIFFSWYWYQQKRGSSFNFEFFSISKILLWVFHSAFYKTIKNRIYSSTHHCQSKQYLFQRRTKIYRIYKWGWGEKKKPNEILVED